MEKEKSALKVHIEYGDLKADFEGSPEEVIKEINSFLSQTLPTYTVASKLLFLPDYHKICEDLSEYVKVSQEGELILLERELPTDKMLSLTLLGYTIAFKLSKISSEEVSTNKLARVTGKTKKTIQNTLIEMCKKGEVERVDKGTYRLTPLGVNEAYKTVKVLKAEKKEG